MANIDFYNILLIFMNKTIVYINIYNMENLE